MTSIASSMRRADELVGAFGPQAELDALAVDEDEFAVS